MKDELIEIIKELREVIKETGMKCSDDKLLEQACTFWRGGRMEKKGQKKDNAIEPATDKQKGFLVSHGWEGDTSKLSKAEAHALIDEAIKRSKGIEGEY